MSAGPVRGGGAGGLVRASPSGRETCVRARACQALGEPTEPLRGARSEQCSGTRTVRAVTCPGATRPDEGQLSPWLGVQGRPGSPQCCPSAASPAAPDSMAVCRLLNRAGVMPLTPTRGRKACPLPQGRAHTGRMHRHPLPRDLEAALPPAKLVLQICSLEGF